MLLSLRLILIGLCILPGYLFGGTEPEYAVIIYLQPKNESIANPKLQKHEQRRANLLSLREYANVSQGHLVKLLRQKGKTDVRTLWINNSIATNLTAKEIAEIENMPGVLSVSPDKIVAQAEPSPQAAGVPGWNLDMVGAPSLWTLGYEGQEIVVASMDSGVDGQQAAIARQYRGGSNSWYDPYQEHNLPYDSTGHGTSVLSLIVGGDLLLTNVATAVGVAPSAKWIAVKIFNDLGKASVSAIHQAFQWLLDPDGDPNTDDAPDVVNMSWGLSASPNQCDPEYQNDIFALSAADIALVAAAGNTGGAANTSISPANYIETISVGSIGQNEIVSTFSGRGASACDGSIFPSFVAPGESVLTGDRTSGGIYKSSSAYVSGTSFSTAHVSGVIALLRGAFPTMSAVSIQEALTNTSKDLGALGPDNDYGLGLVKAQDAFNLLSQTNTAINPATTCTVDSDGDGAVDCHDGCPGNPEKVELGVCGCSVTDTDSDKDGTPDCIDACPNDPLKIALPCSTTPTPGGGTTTPPPSGGTGGTTPPTTSPSTGTSGGCDQTSSGDASVAGLSLLFLILTFLRNRRFLSAR